MFHRNDKKERLKKIRREKHKELKRIRLEKQKEIDDESIKYYNKIISKAELIGRRRNESDSDLIRRYEEEYDVLQSLGSKFLILIIVVGTVSYFLENHIEKVIYLLLFLATLFFYFLSFKKNPYGKNNKRMFNLVEIKHIITVRIVSIITIISPLLFQPLVKTMHFSARLLVYSHL